MSVALILGQALIGWLIADLLRGLFHWWEDRVARTDWPIIGPAVVAPNRLHHVDVLAFTRSSLIARNAAVWVIVMVISGVWFALAGASVTWATATLGGLIVNEVHRMAHLPASAGRVAAVFQDMGLLQSPKHHAGHHRGQNVRRYCILTDWLNPALDALGVWSRLEHAMARIGLEPNGGTK